MSSSLVNLVHLYHHRPPGSSISSATILGRISRQEYPHPTSDPSQNCPSSVARWWMYKTCTGHDCEPPAISPGPPKRAPPRTPAPASCSVSPKRCLVRVPDRRYASASRLIPPTDRRNMQLAVRVGIRYPKAMSWYGQQTSISLGPAPHRHKAGRATSAIFPPRGRLLVQMLLRMHFMAAASTQVYASVQDPLLPETVHA